MKAGTGQYNAFKKRSRNELYVLQPEGCRGDVKKKDARVVLKKVADHSNDRIKKKRIADLTSGVVITVA